MTALEAHAPNSSVPAGGEARPAPASTRRLALKGSAWTVASYGVSQVLALASSVLLARYFLNPEHFGYMAMATVFIRGLQMFSDLGIGPSIIQHRRGEERAFLNTAWTVQVIRGVVLWLATCAIAWPVSLAYGRMYLWLLPVTGLSALVAGFSSTSLFTVNRRLAYARMALLELVCQAVTITVMFAWAFADPSVWALVVGTLAGVLVRAVLSHAVLGGFNDRFAIDPSALRDLVRFGGWITASTAVTFIACQADRLILGIVVPAAILGVYSIALRLARLPVEVSATVANGVLFPALSRVARADMRSLAPSFARGRSAVLPFSIVVTLGVALGAPVVVHLYGQRYDAAAWMAPLLALAVWFELLQNSTDRVLLTIGNTRALALSNAVKAAVTVAGCLVGHRVWGMQGFILGVGAGSWAALAVVQAAVERAGLPVFRADTRATLLVLALWALSTACSLAMYRALPGSQLLNEAVPALAIGGAAAAWALLRVKRAFAD